MQTDSVSLEAREAADELCAGGFPCHTEVLAGLARFEALIRADAYEQAAKWQPIETAPQIEFQTILLGREGKANGSAMPCFWDGENWKCATIFGQGIVYRDPTHWMPLPKPPSEQPAKTRQDQGDAGTTEV
jgi:hypothetical protein